MKEYGTLKVRSGGRGEMLLQVVWDAEDARRFAVDLLDRLLFGGDGDVGVWVQGDWLEREGPVEVPDEVTKSSVILDDDVKEPPG